MNLASLISSFSTAATYAVTRMARGSVVRGRKEDGAVTTFTVVGSVSPASGRDVLNLPEGRARNEMRVIFTTTQLLAGGQGEPYESDKVTIDGSQWEVAHCETWVDSRSRGTAYKALVTLV